jgi:low affinity Fe/Cu permease
MRKKSIFNRFSSVATTATGSSYAFILAVLVVVAWGVSGPILKFSNNWQLVINTGTTIITFLMVFLIQSSQNRDGKALQIKLDEILSTMGSTQKALLDLEELDDAALHLRCKKYHELAEEARKKLACGESDTECKKRGAGKGRRPVRPARKSPRHGFGNRAAVSAEGPATYT